ncbi:EF hand domain-containing protein, partial [Cardiosporidium cionae]
MASIWSVPEFVDHSILEAYRISPESFQTSCADSSAYPRAARFYVKVLEKLMESGMSLPTIAKESLHAIKYIMLEFEDNLWFRFVQLVENGADIPQLRDYVQAVVSRLMNVRAGETAILPGAIRLHKNSSPIWLVYLIHRHKITSSWTFAVVNASGFGTEYHAVKFSDEILPGALQRDLLLTLGSVQSSRLLHSSFWCILHRMALFPSPTNPYTLYSVILPHLNSTPLLLNWNVQFQNATQHGQTSAAEIKRYNTMGGAWNASPPLRSTGSTVSGMNACLHFLFRCFGLTMLEIGNMNVLIEWALCRLIHEQISLLLDAREYESSSAFANRLRPSLSQNIIIQYAVKQMCSLVSARALRQSQSLEIENRLPLSTSFLSTVKREVDTLLQTLNSKLSNTDKGLGVGTCTLTAALGDAQMACDGVIGHPFFGRFRRDGPSTEFLAGESAEAPLVLPVEISRVADHVDSIEDVGKLFRECIDICVLLGNQRKYIKNSYAMRFNLIKHLLIKVIPLPLAPSSRDAKYCFWRNKNFRRDTQIDLLRLLHSLTRHFLCAALSTYNSRTMDAERITCMAVICVLADTIVRKIAYDIPSPFSQHYDGTAEGPLSRFAFDITWYADESEFFLLLDPAFAIARSQVLDYTFDILKDVKEDHHIFNWEGSGAFGVGDRLLIEQLCVRYGYPRGTALLPEYFCGSNPEIIDLFPELGYLRDIVFFFKALMVPSAQALPEQNLWTLADTAISWGYNSKTERFSVMSFGKSLECFAFVKDDYYEQKYKKRGLVSRFFSWFGSQNTLRTIPSAADPSHLVEGHRIDTEDDVLHIKTLPNFDGRLSQYDSELLLQYLTAPYLRIPLVMQFFATEIKFDALSSPELRNVVMACLFEASIWLHESEKLLPNMIPPPSREYLATPVGLLFNELQ